MNRISSSKAIEALGDRVIIDIWKCFDRHSEIYGKPSEKNSFMRKINVSSIAGKIFLRFELNKIYAITCRENRNIDIAIVCFEDDDLEIIITSEEIETIFGEICKGEREVCQVM